MDDEARRVRYASPKRRAGRFCERKVGKRIPPLVELPELLSAGEHVVEDKARKKICGCYSRRAHL